MTIHNKFAHRLSSVSKYSKTQIYWMKKKKEDYLEYIPFRKTPQSMYKRINKQFFANISFKEYYNSTFLHNNLLKDRLLLPIFFLVLVLFSRWKLVWFSIYYISTLFILSLSRTYSGGLLLPLHTMFHDVFLAEELWSTGVCGFCILSIVELLMVLFYCRDDCLMRGDGYIYL